MSLIEKCALGLVLLFLLVACLRLLRQPLKLALRVLINSALGFCALWLLNLTTAVTGMSLGLNLFNALTIGVLGVPGLGLLLLLKWVLVERPRQSLSFPLIRRMRSASGLHTRRSNVRSPLTSSSTSLTWV